MTPEHLNDRRLSPEQEDRVKHILTVGSDAIVEELKAHQAAGLDEGVDAAFQRALEIMAKSIAQVAALKEFQVGKAPSTGRRLAFMPGYVKKDRKRVVFVVTDGPDKPIPSDIVHSIRGEDDVPRVPGLLNQAKLFHALLHEHPDDDGFANGGTHQFLVANERALKDFVGYQLDVLHISTAKEKKSKSNHATSQGFRKLVVDYATTTTCAELADYLRSKLNADGLKPWPYNFQDVETDDRMAEIRQVRAHLVALWCKVLFDRGAKGEIDWIEDCAALADKHGFTKLKARIQQLPNAISNTPEEKFDHWYSIRLTSLPDFGTGRNESFGSAMLLTNFELDARWFYYIRSWINRVYHYFRSFENTKALSQRHKEDLYYIPLDVPGGQDRLNNYRARTGFNAPIREYFEACIKDPDLQERLGETYADAMKVLLPFARLRGLEFIRNKGGTDLEERIAEVRKELNTHSLVRSYTTDCGQVHEAGACTHFLNKLFGRFVAVGAHLCLGMSWDAIHSFLSSKGAADTLHIRPSTGGRDPAHAFVKKNFFIAGVIEDQAPRHDRERAAANLYYALSPYERVLVGRLWNTIDATVAGFDFTEPYRAQLNKDISMWLPTEASSPR